MISVQSMKVPHTGVIRAGLLVFLAILVAILGFSGALTELVHRWNQQEEYSHGFLIPVVTAWLLWTRRDALRANIGQPSWIGPVLILLAIAMHITGELSAIFILSQIGFVVALDRDSARDRRLLSSQSGLHPDRIPALRHSPAVLH